VGVLFQWEYWSSGSTVPVGVWLLGSRVGVLKVRVQEPKVQGTGLKWEFGPSGDWLSRCFLLQNHIHTGRREASIQIMHLLD
jgi:hypothetical protein